LNHSSVGRKYRRFGCAGPRVLFTTGGGVDQRGPPERSVAENPFLFLQQLKKTCKLPGWVV
jgi:hypothetical protein